jgi:hypothetical protein
LTYDRVKIVVHRVNTVAYLQTIPTEYGAEIDIRADSSRLILNHEPTPDGELLIDFLTEYRHGLLVLNIKEAGIEDEVLRLVRERGVAEHFLLDVEFPYMHRAARRGERAFALRYSEEESIETVRHYIGRADWVWIDTFTRLPLDSATVAALTPFRTCLVCPERWGRPHDIPGYKREMARLRFEPHAVMTTMHYATIWADAGRV